MNKYVFSAILAAAGLVGTSASAVTLTYKGAAFGGFGAAHFDATPGDVDPAATSVAAGAFLMSKEGEDFLAYCLDLETWLAKTSDYTLTETPWSFNDLASSGAVDRIQDIYDANYHLVDTLEESAAFQLLLWNAIYDDDYDLTDGEFQAHSTTAGVDIAAVTFAANAAGYGDGEQVWKLGFYEADERESQSLVTATEVPLPAGGLLLVSALAGASTLRKRRRS